MMYVRSNNKLRYCLQHLVKIVFSLITLNTSICFKASITKQKQNQVSDSLECED